MAKSTRASLPFWYAPIMIRSFSFSYVARTSRNLVAACRCSGGTTEVITRLTLSETLIAG